MAAVSLFWDTNMATVTSRENTLFGGHFPLLNHGSQLIRLFEESFQHTFNQVFCFLAQSDEKQQLNNKSFCREIAQAYLKRLLFRIDIIDEN